MAESFGIDRDEVELEIARKEAVEQGLGNVQYHSRDARRSRGVGGFPSSRVSSDALGSLSLPITATISTAANVSGMVRLQQAGVTARTTQPREKMYRLFDGSGRMNWSVCPRTCARLQCLVGLRSVLER